MCKSLKADIKICRFKLYKPNKKPKMYIVKRKIVTNVQKHQKCKKKSKKLKTKLDTRTKLIIVERKLAPSKGKWFRKVTIY